MFVRRVDRLAERGDVRGEGDRGIKNDYYIFTWVTENEKTEGRGDMKGEASQEFVTSEMIIRHRF